MADYEVSADFAADSKFNRFARAEGTMAPALCRQRAAGTADAAAGLTAAAVDGS